MNTQVNKMFFDMAPLAFSCFEVLFDDLNLPCDLIFTKVNPCYENIMKIKKSDILGKSFFSVCKDSWVYNYEWKKVLRDVFVNQNNVTFDIYNENLGKWFRTNAYTLDSSHMACIFTDVDFEHQLSHQLNEMCSLKADIFCVLNSEGNIIRIGDKFCKVTGYSMTELIGKYYFSFLHNNDISSSAKALLKEYNNTDNKIITNRFRCKDNTYKYFEWHYDKKNDNIFCIAKDITQRYSKDFELNAAAYKDTLTGLYNRFYFYKIISDEIEKADTFNETLSLIILDIDNFKRVNDSWGHPIGNTLLEQTAKVITNTIRRSDFTARIGGDEFVILLTNTDIKGANVVVNKLRDAFNDTRHPVIGKFTVSFGISQRNELEFFNDWYKRTDDALYAAKANGRNCAVIAKDPVTHALASYHLNNTDTWKCGNDLLDEQHHKLIEICSKLMSAAYGNNSTADINILLEELLDVLATHFRDEESLQISIGYDGFKNHNRSHEKILRKALKLKDAFKKDEIEATSFVTLLADNIIISHITTEDVKYFPYLSNCK